MKGIYVLLLCITASNGISQDLLTPFLDSCFQTTYYNPATPTSGSINISSGLSGAISSNSLSYRDIIKTNASGDNYIDLDNTQNLLKPDNYLTTDLSVHTLDLGINFSSFSIIAGHAWKLTGLFDYPEDLGRLIANGNAPFIGETLEVGPAFDFSAYNEIYLGAVAAMGNFRLGVKGKYLSGVENVTTENRKIDITTSDDIYQVTVESDYIIHSSRLLELNDITDFSFDFEGISFKNFMSKNKGFAVDAGIYCEVSDRLNLGVSVIDIGSITWDNDPRNYTSQKSQTFDGIDIVSYLGDTTTIALEDSLYNLLAFDKSQNNYTSKLPLKAMFTTTYKLNDQWIIGAVLHSRKYKETLQSSLGLHSQYRFNRIFTLGSTLQFSNESILQIGLAGRVNTGVVDIFATCNNIVALFDPLDHKSAQVRLGGTLRL